MHDIPLLKELIVILVIVIPAILVGMRLRIPSIVVFLIVGGVLGPSAFGLVESRHEVELLAEIGVVLLLFTIGLEFSLEKLGRLKFLVLFAGGGQVGLTILVVWSTAMYGGVSFERAMVLGFLVALSSTVIVLKTLGARGEVDTPEGRVSLSILLFQDLMIVPMMLILPLLAAGADGGGVDLGSLTATIGVAFGGVVFILVGAYLVVPYLLKFTASANNRELFLLTVIFIVFGTAYIATYFGLSLALGAFLAGLIVSESDYADQVVADVLPMRDALSSLFFIAMGMFLDVDFLRENYAQVLGAAAIILLLKGAIITFVVYAMSYPLRLAIVSGLILGQIGEFSFILALSANEYRLIAEQDYQLFLSASVATMMLAPFLIRYAGRFGFLLEDRLGLERLSQPFVQLRRILSRERTEETGVREAGADAAPESASPAKTKAKTEKSDALSGHVIIVGFGKSGQQLSQVLGRVGIKFVVCEIDHRRFRLAREQDSPAIYGDAASTEILHKLHVHSASSLVLTAGTPDIVARTVRVARKENPRIHVIARTRYIDDIESLRLAGVDQVVPEEMETSIEIFSLVLRHYHIPRNVVATQIAVIRSEDYGPLVGNEAGSTQSKLEQLTHILSATATESGLLLDDSPAIGKSVADTNIFGETNVTIIAVVRSDQSVAHNPGGDFVFAAGDIVIMIGTHADIDAALGVLGGKVVS